jgi:hypothetical protein
VSAGSQASFFTQKAFGQLVPTPPQIASYLNNATGGQFSYLINSLLLNSGGWFFYFQAKFCASVVLCRT